MKLLDKAQIFQSEMQNNDFANPIFTSKCIHIHLYAEVPPHICSQAWKLRI